MDNQIAKRGRGRPPLLDATPELAEEMAEYLEDGLYIQEACTLAGVSKSSVYKILRKGTADIEAGESTPEADFTHAIKRALASAERESLKAVRAAGKLPQFWAADAWYLERRYPGKYGKKDRVALEHSGSMGIGVATVDKPLSERLNDEEKRAAAKDIARSLAIIGSGTGSPIRGADSPSEFGNEWEGEDTEPSSLSEFEAN